MCRLLMLTIIATSAIAFGGAIAAGAWEVRRATMSGACSLQPAGTSPPLGVLLTTKPTKKDACQAAGSLNTDDAGDSSKCFGYTVNTESLCKAEGVDLP